MEREICPKCGDNLVPVYTAKTLAEFLQRKRPDFWFCDRCQLDYKETETGKLKRSTPHWPKHFVGVT